MSCRYCGAALPPDAIMCGECGRSVSGERGARGATSTTVRIPRLAPRPPAAEGRCPQCAEPVSREDVFCRECGFVLRTASLGARGGEAVREPGPDPAPEAGAVAGSGPEPDPAPSPGLAPVPAREADPAPASDPAPTRAAPRGPSERFILQFSTGESVTVSGTGLIGRNPVAQPGEDVDQFVVVSDLGRSVSKTHLEFGQEDGVFWVSDRYTTNGTVLRAPDAEPRRCEPGRRYRLERGSRVEIGEQFFVVS